MSKKCILRNKKTGLEIELEVSSYNELQSFMGFSGVGRAQKTSARWTEEEKELLKNNMKSSTSKLKRLLPRHTIKAIYTRKSIMKNDGYEKTH